MPAPDSFVDTNILLYAISTDPTEAEKSTVARNLLMTANWAWSAQVAAEFVNASTSARRPVPLTLVQAERWIDTWMAFLLIPTDGTIVKETIRLAELPSDLCSTDGKAGGRIRGNRADEILGTAEKNDFGICFSAPHPIPHGHLPGVTGQGRVNR